MGDHPDVDIIRRGHQAFNDRDYETLKGFFAEDIVWHQDGRGPNAGTYEGRESLMRDLFGPLKDAPVRLEDHDVLANGEHLVALATAHIDAGEMHSFRVVEVCHTRDGKITERWGTAFDQQGLDELFARLMGG